jgi:hypothetical protein
VALALALLVLVVVDGVDGVWVWFGVGVLPLTSIGAVLGVVDTAVVVVVVVDVGGCVVEVDVADVDGVNGVANDVPCGVDVEGVFVV